MIPQLQSETFQRTVMCGSVRASFRTDFLSIQQAREHTGGWIHFLGNTTVLALTRMTLMLCLSDPATAALPWGAGPVGGDDWAAACW